MPPKKTNIVPNKPNIAPKKAKKSDTKDAEDIIETEQAVEKTTGALGALKKQGLSKDPPAIPSTRKT
ncbi:hypothetical protein FRC04_008435 [Tulasnella sp. 424]|nr:hypothetical protein FRC04_008435 [Tulasnella sp. 424]KAG8959111.1 hypothetical protein FRC05_008058 [Tulasnella sp. 425]